MVKTLNIKEVSELTHIGKSSLYKLARSGDIPCMRVGSKYIFTAESIDEWLQKQVSQNAAFGSKK